VAPAVVADSSLLVFGHGVEQPSEQRLDRMAVELGACNRLVQVVDVRLMVLPVVDAHRLLVDRRLERVVVVGKRGELVGHWHFSFGWLSPGEDMLRAAPVKPEGETWRLLITTRRSPRAS
jgi:hypothetical protein